MKLLCTFGFGDGEFHIPGPHKSTLCGISITRVGSWGKEEEVEPDRFDVHENPPTCTECLSVLRFCKNLQLPK